MSDKPIQVGDLVMVVREHLCCHGSSVHYGRVFRVTHFRQTGPIPCPSCGDKSDLTMAMGEGIVRGYDIRRLKRLDPDALKDDVPTKEELHA